MSSLNAHQAIIDGENAIVYAYKKEGGWYVMTDLFDVHWNWFGFEAPFFGTSAEAEIHMTNLTQKIVVLTPRQSLK